MPNDRPNHSSPAPASPKSRDVKGGPPSPEIGEMQRNKKMNAAERYFEAMDRLDGQFGDGRLYDEWVASIKAAVAEERARWLAWATDLGYGEQEIPK